VAETVAVEGDEEVAKALREMKRIARAAVKDAKLEGAREVARDASPRVPVLSGRLALSLNVSAQGDMGAVTAGGGSVTYAGPIHFGWPRKHIRPQPFLYEALDAKRQAVMDIFESRLAIVLALE
jgi:hypothetical protein